MTLFWHAFLTVNRVFILYWGSSAMMKVREPECILLKRRGAEHVAKLVADMSLPEQLEFWRQRTEAMLARQQQSSQKLRGAIERSLDDS